MEKDRGINQYLLPEIKSSSTAVPQNGTIADFATTVDKEKPAYDGYLLNGRLKHLHAKSVVLVEGRRVELGRKENILLKVLGTYAHITLPFGVLEREVGLDGKTARKELLSLARGLRYRFDDYFRRPIISSKYGVGVRLGELDPSKRYDETLDTVVDVMPIEILQGKFQYYPETKAVKVNGIVRELNEQEDGLLAILHENTNRTVPLETLFGKVWRDKSFKARLVQSTIRHLRQKVEPDPNIPVFIQTDRSIGYRLGDLDESQT